MASVWERLSDLPQLPDGESAPNAVLIPLYEDDSGAVRVILTKRPGHMKSHAHDVVFPGGRVEEGESAVAAATREAWEEIGLPPESVLEVLGSLDSVSTRRPTRWITPVVARVVRPAELVPNPAEVEAILEPTLDLLADDDAWHVSNWFGRQMWFYEFPEGTLWGATAYLMRNLLQHLR